MLCSSRQHIRSINCSTQQMLGALQYYSVPTGVQYEVGGTYIIDWNEFAKSPVAHFDGAAVIGPSITLNSRENMYAHQHLITFDNSFFSKDPHLEFAIPASSHSKWTQGVLFCLLWLELNCYNFFLMRWVNTSIWHITNRDKNIRNKKQIKVSLSSYKISTK